MQCESCYYTKINHHVDDDDCRVKHEGHNSHALCTDLHTNCLPDWLAVFWVFFQSSAMIIFVYRDGSPHSKITQKSQKTCLMMNFNVKNQMMRINNVYTDFSLKNIFHFILTFFLSFHFIVFTVNRTEGELLNFTSVTRFHMGAYLCIASNGVPPSVSRRIVLSITRKSPPFKSVLYLLGI